MDLGDEVTISSFPLLETARLRLRKVGVEDAEEMFEYCSLREVSMYVGWNPHKNIDDTKLFIHRLLKGSANTGSLLWGIELKENSKLIGTINYADLNEKHKRGELAYILSSTYWGKGIMTEAVKEVIKYGFEEIRLNRIEAKCMIDNIGSEMVMKKAGMTYEGVLREYMFTKGEYRDLKIYSILKMDY